jgi:hypothetical protein
MKKLFLISITFLILQACSSNESNSNTNSTTSSGNVDYEFNVTIDNYVHKVKGNTANDEGFKGPLKNKCTATGAWSIALSITDVSYSNYVTGIPNSFTLFASSPTNFVLGTNYMNTTIPYYKNYGASPGAAAANNAIPVIITDLGTSSTGTLGTSNYRYGNTIKGYYKGVLYSLPAGSNNATEPHNVSIDFKAVRLY